MDADSDQQAQNALKFLWPVIILGSVTYKTTP
jgi:hypothetical protein